MNFFKINDKGKPCVDYALGNDWESIKCSEVDDHQRAGKRITALTLKLITTKIVDFSWSTLADIVVSQRAIEIFRESRLSGFRVEPVKLVQNKKLEKIGNVSLWEFIALGCGGNAHLSSGITLKTNCKACGLQIFSAFEKGIVIDEKKWDGSDFFSVIEYPKYVFCSERAKNIIENNMLTNIELIPSKELKWPEGVIKP